MNYTSGWFAAVRAVLELLYFASGIAIAVAAFWALKQLRITKQIAKTNAKRESFKLAADECRVYAREIIPLQQKFQNEYKRLGLSFLTTPPPKYRIDNGEIVEHNFPMKRLQDEVPKVIGALIEYLNALEAFAIFFTAGVADEELGFREVALTFCKTTGKHMAVYFLLRNTNSGRYESTIKLFDMWSKRLIANAAASNMKSMSDLIDAAEKERIKPKGTED